VETEETETAISVSTVKNRKVIHDEPPT